MQQMIQLPSYGSSMAMAADQSPMGVPMPVVNELLKDDNGSGDGYQYEDQPSYNEILINESSYD